MWAALAGYRAAGTQETLLDKVKAHSCMNWTVSKHALSKSAVECWSITKMNVKEIIGVLYIFLAINIRNCILVFEGVTTDWFMSLLTWQFSCCVSMMWMSLVAQRSLTCAQNMGLHEICFWK